MAATPAPSQRLDPALRNLMWVLVIGAIAPALDTTIVNVALAALERAMHAPVATTQWTITGYLLATGIAIPVSGWATERFGGRRVWLFSLTLFLAGSAASGAAWNMASLIVFRVIQGAGAGLLLPVAVTLLVQAAKGQQLGRLMAMVTLPVVVVPVFGPVIGGLITSNLSWRWIFYVNVPVCLAAIALAVRYVPRDAPAGRQGHLDIAGLALLSPGLALVIYGLSQATGRSGFGTRSVIIPLAAGLALSAAFAVHALRTRRKPLIDVRVFRVRSYTASISVFLLAGLSLYGPLLLLSLYYQQLLGKTALATGLLLAPQGIGSLLPRTVAGKLTDKLGPRPVVIVGLVLTALGTLPYAQAGPATSQWLLAAALLVRGAGLAAATIAVMAGAFRGLKPAEVPDASSTTRIVQQVGGSFGAAVLAVILTHELLARAAAPAHAYDIAFWWAVGFGALAILPALLLPGRTPKDSTPPQQPSKVPDSTRR
jgi:EmrB/QacA subfamily drug resistance transporter